MATSAQLAANQTNAQLSTGPRTETGKAVVSRNRLSHGLSSSTFVLLPGEDPAEFTSLETALIGEHKPSGPTEKFLVGELARAQWKLDRIVAIEAAILAGSQDNLCDTWSDLARQFQNDCAGADALAKLNRYEQAARRAWHKALEQLQTLRKTRGTIQTLEAKADAFLAKALANPLPLPRLAPRALPNYDSKPMPEHLRRELEAHQRRNPAFDPELDRSQMSRQLQKFFA
jgi:hypothetical protein